jgi:hypothetical protein
MIFLENYKDFKFKDDVEEILLNLRDLIYLVVRIGKDENIEPILIITIPLDNYVSNIVKKSKDGQYYRPLKNSEIVPNIISSYNRLNDLPSIEINKVEVTWINAGEDIKGPGSFKKIFNKSFLKNEDNLLSNFLKSKGDKVRLVKMYFDISN